MGVVTMIALLVLAICYSIAVTWLLVVALGGNRAVAKELREERAENKRLRAKLAQAEDDVACLRTLNKAMIGATGISAAELAEAATPLWEAVVWERIVEQESGEGSL